MLLQIKELQASIQEKKILNGLTLSIGAGEVHAIMGPNGAGKSTMAKLLAGHPAYEVNSGTVEFDGQDLLAMEPEERARAGLFLSFQYPLEIPGLSNRHFLFTAFKTRFPTLTEEQFNVLLKAEREDLQIPAEFETRGVNEGFSGGEKKRNEILQMALFQPKLALLDETDSGLDIDAMKLIAQSIQKARAQGTSFILITHYQRLLDYVRPDFVHVLQDGVITRTGDADLARELEATGYTS